MKLLAGYSLGIAGRLTLSSLCPKPPLSQEMDRDGHLSNGAKLYDRREDTNCSPTQMLVPNSQIIWAAMVVLSCKTGEVTVEEYSN